MRTLVATGTMLKANAKKLIGQLDLSIPFSTRLQFIRSVAALVALYPDEVAKTTTDGKTLQHFLWNSCEAKVIEYKLNYTRLLHKVDNTLRPFISAGSTSIEALHSEINNIVLTKTNTYYLPTIILKLQIFRLAKLWNHHIAMSRTTNRSYEHRDVMVRRISALEAFDESAWLMHCASPVNTPLCKLGAEHIRAVKKHKAKTKPAKYVKSFKLPDKTVLVIKGVKKTLQCHSV